MTMTPMNALFHQATTQPDGIAFVYDDVVWTYHDLLTGAERMSRAFLAHGVRPGDRVVLHMPNRPEMAIAVYACFRIGAIACPTNLRFKTAELREVFQRLQPALYLGEEQLYSYVETIEPEILTKEKRFVTGPGGVYRGAMPWWGLLINSGAGRLPPEPDKDAPAVLLTTSGTTGAPKFVTHTPTTLSALANAFADTDLESAQIVLNACPMVHATGLFTFLLSVSCGAPMVMVERFDPDAVLDRIELHGCTWMLGLPFMYDALLERQRKQPRNGRLAPVLQMWRRRVSQPAAGGVRSGLRRAATQHVGRDRGGRRAKGWLTAWACHSDCAGRADSSRGRRRQGCTERRSR
jgi:long-chain acyl-CoA synthetase